MKQTLALAPLTGEKTLLEKYSPEQVLRALRTVLTHTITDAFDLTSEESMWVSFHVDQILSPIGAARPKAVPLPVRKELESRLYSHRLAEREGRVIIPRAADPGVKQGALEDWAAVFSETVRQCYDLRPLVQASIDGQFTGLLLELGVGHPTNPRAGRYLPTAVRYLLSHKD